MNIFYVLHVYELPHNKSLYNLVLFVLCWRNKVNREALPLIGALLIPIALISVVLLYHFGYDVTVLLRQIDLIYYIIMVPIVLGLLVAILRREKA